MKKKSNHILSVIGLIFIMLAGWGNVYADGPVNFDSLPFQFKLMQEKGEPYWIEISNYLNHYNKEGIQLDEEYLLNDVVSSDNPKSCIVRKIGDSAFLSSYMQYINLPSSVVEIGSFAFQNSKIERIKLSENLRVISSYAFSFSNLKKVEIPESIEYIGPQAFRQCEELRTVILPSTLKQLNGYTFIDCQNLVYVICKAKTPPVANDSDFHSYWLGLWIPYDSQSSIAIDHVRCWLFVPRESIELYRNALGWRYFHNIVAIEDIDLYKF